MVIRKGGGFFFVFKRTIYTLLSLLTFSSKDLAFHAAWVLCWFIASVTWAVSFNHLRDMVGNVLSHGGEPVICPENSESEIIRGQYAQAAIAVVSCVQLLFFSLCRLLYLHHCLFVQIFGFLSLFLWAANIYWVLIDTAIYIQWKARRAASSY